MSPIRSWWPSITCFPTKSATTNWAIFTSITFDSSARGIIVGLTRYANKGHVARATLETTAYQTREVLDAMELDMKTKIDVLRTDGGMVVNDLLMQFQADILGRDVIRPLVRETTALGASYAAALAVGFYKDLAELREQMGRRLHLETVHGRQYSRASVCRLEKSRHTFAQLG